MSLHLSYLYKSHEGYRSKPHSKGYNTGGSLL